MTIYNLSHRNTRVTKLSCVTTSTIQFESCNNFWDLVDKKYDVITLLSNNFILRRPKVANFPDTFKIATMLIKTSLKIHKKLKELEAMN